MSKIGNLQNENETYLKSEDLPVIDQGSVAIDQLYQ